MERKGNLLRGSGGAARARLWPAWQDRADSRGRLSAFRSGIPEWQVYQGRSVGLDHPTRRMTQLSTKAPTRQMEDESALGGVKVGLKEGHPRVPLSDRSRCLMAGTRALARFFVLPSDLPRLPAAWCSLPGGQGVVGSNPAVPTEK